MESGGIKFQPKFGRVLIEREANTKTAGGIILPDAKKHAKCEGVIRALGETAGWVEVPGKGHVQNMKVGDKVIFGRYSGTWLNSTYGNDAENDDGTLYICKDEDILAIVKE